MRQDGAIRGDEERRRRLKLAVVEDGVGAGSEVARERTRGGEGGGRKEAGDEGSRTARLAGGARTGRRWWREGGGVERAREELGCVEEEGAG